MSSLQSAATSDRTLAMLRTALGPVITQALDDPKVVEIMLNPDGRLWLDKLGVGRFDTDSVLTPDAPCRQSHQSGRDNESANYQCRASGEWRAF